MKNKKHPAQKLGKNPKSNVSEDGLNLHDHYKELTKAEEELEEKVTRNDDAYRTRAERSKRLAQLYVSMTPMQEKFVKNYVAKNFGSIPELMISIGTKGKPENLHQIYHTFSKNVKIKEAIGLETQLRLEAEGTSRNEVVQMLRDSFAVAITSGSVKDANEAAKLLGMAMGMFNAKDVGVRGVNREVTSEVTRLGKLANQFPELITDEVGGKFEGVSYTQEGITTEEEEQMFEQGDMESIDESLKKLLDVASSPTEKLN